MACGVGHNRQLERVAGQLRPLLGKLDLDRGLTPECRRAQGGDLGFGDSRSVVTAATRAVAVAEPLAVAAAAAACVSALLAARGFGIVVGRGVARATPMRTSNARVAF